MSVLYPITQATVISQSPDTNSVVVMLKDGQGPAFPIPILCPGPSDGLRIKQSSMPGRGTLGIVAFVNNDIRNGVWLGAIPASQTDAISNPPNMPFLDYEAHFSGHWSALDQVGNQTTSFADGSSVVVGAKFTPYRHIQSATGARLRVPVAASDRPTPASPFPMTIDHISGTTVSIATNGNVVVSSVGTISASSPSQITATAPVVEITNGGTTQYLVTKTAWEYLTTHVHSGVAGGSSDTGPPVSVPSSGVLTTVLVAQ